MANEKQPVQKRKSLIEILRSDVSAGTFKDLLMYEIPLPYSATTLERARAAARDQELTEEELKDLVAALERESDQISSLLNDWGIIKEEDLEKIEEEKEKTGLPILQVLVNMKIVSPDEIADLAQSLRHAVELAEKSTKLEDCLTKRSLVGEEALQNAKELARSKKTSLELALLETGAMRFKDLATVLTEEFGIPSVALTKDKIDRVLVNLIPDNIMKDFRLIPFSRKHDRLDLAMADPRDEVALHKVRMITGLDPKPHFADPTVLARVQENFIVEISAGARVVSTESATRELEELAGSESTVKLVNNIIEGAANARATDIHLEPQEESLRVRYRVDGMLYDLMRIPGEQAAPTVSRIKVLAGMDITERRRPQDGHVTVTTDHKEINLRAATLPTHHGEKIVLRVINDSSVMRGLPQLGLTSDEMAKIRELITRPHGMFLVTGPMGSGKTTTLYAALGEVNTPNRNIVTIEDPIEYTLPGVNQVQVDHRVDLTFASGLRAVLRQDANVLMVGEIRDPETAGVAARAASTGHLLFSTLHSNTAIGAISALRHLGVPSFIIANTLICVAAQRLIRVVCPHCSEDYVPPKSVAAALGLTTKTRKKITRSRGCDECLNTGYIGRTGIYEMLEISEKIAECITDERSEKEILEASVADGHLTLQDAAIQKVLEGVTTAEELFRVIAI